MSTSRRAVGIAALAVIATGVSGCGSSQLFHDSNTAASYQGTSVSVQQVQDAVTQIKQAFGSGAADFNSRTAITYLVLGKDLQRIAAENGAPFSADQARQEFARRKVANPSSAAIDALRSNVALTNLSNSQAGIAEVSKVVNAAKVDVNPRFGRWGGANGVLATAEPWIAGKSTSKS
ncbi:hypothetical protein [Allobranchiibius sp. CTAmp26]|uniref:hypothetical protein n=1 Tax=Allobranchiibius sp. CTAmp26 TaxID=2815214 RepID=UPI001AA0F613|nr:hypothetical protein [Allobranchiibius sp. CTAmp26]MBO1753499.1 hypothetical protein [Allobranchiibius sp. CTAmp26]